MDKQTAEAAKELVNTAVGRGWSWEEEKRDGELQIILHHPCMGDGEGVAVSQETICEYEPETILRAAKDGRDVSHMTRVVGYFSKTENWNPSKLGELRDRRAGDYAV